MFDIFSQKRKTRRSLKWCVKLRNTTISKHYTKKAAMKASKRVWGSKVQKIGSYSRKRKYKRY